MDCRLMDLDVGDMNEFMNGLKAWIHNIFYVNFWKSNKHEINFILVYYSIKNLKKRYNSLTF